MVEGEVIDERFAPVSSIALSRKCQYRAV